MRDRGMKKWKPFNAVVPSSYLKNQETLPVPSLSENEILECEELLKKSLYTKKINIKMYKIGCTTRTVELNSL
mgnify:CR=1 FL=1